MQSTAYPKFPGDIKKEQRTVSYTIKFSVQRSWVIVGLLFTLLCTSAVLVLRTSDTRAQEALPEEADSEEDEVDTEDAPSSDNEAHTFAGVTANSAMLASVLEQTGGFTNIQQIRLDGVAMTMSGNDMVLSNLRIASDSTTLDDFLRISFSLDASRLQLIPTEVEVVTNLGLYDPQERIFTKDVTTELELVKPDGTKLAADTLHTFTASATDAFTISLESGTILTMRLRDPSDDIDLQIDNPDGSARDRSLYREGSNWSLFDRTILESGIYTIRFVPRNDETVRLKFGVTNNNQTMTTTINSGDRINTSFGDWGQDYAKYRIELQRGDIISVSNPRDDDVYLSLFDSNGSRSSRTGGELLERIYTTGVYYLIVQNDDASGGATSYSGTVSVSVDPNRDKYPTLSDIPAQTATAGQPFVLQLSATNDPTQYSVTGLPPGLTYNPATATVTDQLREIGIASAGTITGQPEVTGIFPIQVTTQNAFGNDRRDFLLTIEGVADAAFQENFLPIIIFKE
jgi:hypothetical protein